jgi:hypothetical protein
MSAINVVITNKHISLFYVGLEFVPWVVGGEVPHRRQGYGFLIGVLCKFWP